jgi:hypothetical protein
MNTNSRLVLYAVLLLILPTLQGMQAQTISYIHPDIGSPGMNSLLEFIGPYDARGNFGSDGFYFNNEGDAVRLRCADAADTALVVVGPFVVSWDGRMVSAQIFVHPDANPPSSNWQAVGAAFTIPLEFVINGTAGNRETFYVVRPQPAIIKSGDGVLGSGGTWGVRSPRGAMILDSLELTGTSYSVARVDADINTPGNQGLLPVTIISRGPVRTASGTIITLDADGKHAGPGGGGGGGNYCDFTGDGSDGGDGFTGGGRGGRNRAGNPFGSDEYRNPGESSGPRIVNTGGSLNGVPGGDSPAYEASGGGTGHPFGTSGEGCSSGSGCNPPGGFGGGSGQQQTRAGGGGGYATEGVSSNNGNGGRVHGNAAIIPLAGGSGGASGNPQLGFACSGDGGGGGGAIALFGSTVDGYLFTAHGAPGANASSGDGGSGSGGAVHLGTKMPSGVWKISAVGGFGPGASGGAGRIRMDGPLGWFSGGLPVDESMFSGPSTDTSRFVSRVFTLTGAGNGEDIRLLMKSDRTPWSQIALLSGYGTEWTHEITLPAEDGTYYLSALQSTPDPSSDPYTANPAWVMSQSAANIFIYRTIPAITAETDHRMPGILCDDTVTDSVVVSNSGDGVLSIADASFLLGDRGFTLVEPQSFPLDIAPGASRTFIVRYDRVPGSRGPQSDTLSVLSNSPAASPFLITFGINVDVAEFSFSSTVLAMPAVLLCESPSADSSMTLTNTGTVPLTLQLPVIGNPAFSLLSPSAGSFPITLDPDSTLELRIRVSHGSSGSLASLLEIQSDAAGCGVLQQLILSANASEANLFVDDMPAFRALLCPGASADTTLLLRNDGDVPLTITGLTSSLPAFTVVSPPVPFVLGVGDQRLLRLRFSPAAAGVYVGALSVESMPCAQVTSRVLDGRRDSLQLLAGAVDFGLVRSSTLPVTVPATLSNTGSVAVTVTAVTDVPPFKIVGGVPVTIPPGESADVIVEFDSSLGDGDFQVAMPLSVLPSCEEIELLVEGRSATARALVRTDTLTAQPSETIQLPIYLTNAENLQLFGATSITVDLRYKASMMVPLFNPPGVIVGDERVIRLDLPFNTDANDVALRLPFMVTLGTGDVTPLLLGDVQAVGGELTIDVLHGQLTLQGICREGGDRFFDGSGQVMIKANTPNPFNPVTEISFEVIEAATTQLFVLDMLGRRVATLVDGYLLPGAYTGIFDAVGFPSGVYIAVLSTPTVTKTHRMLLAK